MTIVADLKKIKTCKETIWNRTEFRRTVEKFKCVREKVKPRKEADDISFPR